MPRLLGDEMKDEEAKDTTSLYFEGLGGAAWRSPSRLAHLRHLGRAEV
jgi:hypothetical protein